MNFHHLTFGGHHWMTENPDPKDQVAELLSMLDPGSRTGVQIVVTQSSSPYGFSAYGDKYTVFFPHPGDERLAEMEEKLRAHEVEDKESPSVFVNTGTTNITFPTGP